MHLYFNTFRDMIFLRDLQGFLHLSNKTHVVVNTGDRGLHEVGYTSNKVCTVTI